MYCYLPITKILEIIQKESERNLEETLKTSEILTQRFYSPRLCWCSRLGVTNKNILNDLRNAEPPGRISPLFAFTSLGHLQDFESVLVKNTNRGFGLWTLSDNRNVIFVRTSA